jgi:hypothetical protein
MSVNVPSAAAPGLFYPDISSGQEDMDLSGVHAVCIKRSEGTYYLNPFYPARVTNAGWTAYGGWAPTIWQYSSSVPLHGKAVDFNAFLGSGATDVAALVEEFKSVVLTGKLPGSKTWGQWDTAGKRSLQEIADACGMSPAAVLRATAVHYGRYDQVTHDYVDSIFRGGVDATAKMPAGARLWVLR